MVGAEYKQLLTSKSYFSCIRFSIFVYVGFIEWFYVDLYRFYLYLDHQTCCLASWLYMSKPYVWDVSKHFLTILMWLVTNYCFYITKSGDKAVVPLLYHFGIIYDNISWVGSLMEEAELQTLWISVCHVCNPCGQFVIYMNM